MEKNYKLKKLFNPDGNDDNRKIIGSNITNVLDLSNIKYPFFIEHVDSRMYPNNWLPHKVANMADDKNQYFNILTDDERKAFDTILSFLIYLDSIQTNNLPNIAEQITSPEIVYFLARQTYEEAIHSRSYAYIVNILPPEKVKEIVYEWRDNPILLKRNKAIAETYELCKGKSEDTYVLMNLVANFLLEGLYFYNGFQFFHNLASRNLMVATDTQIRYIQRDENLHCVGFKEIINIYKEEGFTWDTDLIYKMFKDAVKLELEFSIDTIGNNILGMNEESITNYTYYLANKRLKEIGLDPIFPKTKNPYQHLEKIAAVDDEASNRSNQFETTSITYKDPSILNGWDEI